MSELRGTPFPPNHPIRPVICGQDAEAGGVEVAPLPNQLSRPPGEFTCSGSFSMEPRRFPALGTGEGRWDSFRHPGKLSYLQLSTKRSP